jgi:heme/copper-type cytochrome/quinol oxidase subunit 1
MHPIAHPRNAIFVGVIFVVIGFIYWLVPYLDAPSFTDYAGTVMLGALGIAMAVMAYVLVAGSPRE